MKVTTAISDVSVLLGTNVPELGRLLRSNQKKVHTTTVEETFS